MREEGIKNNLLVGHFSVFPATSLPSCLPFSFPPSPSCLSDFLRACPSCLFGLALMLTSVVSVTGYVFTTPRFILSLLELSFPPHTLDISAWKSHKPLVFPSYSYFSFSFLSSGKYNHHPLSCSSQSPRIFQTPCF